MMKCYNQNSKELRWKGRRPLDCARRRTLTPPPLSEMEIDDVTEMERANRRSQAFVDGWGDRAEMYRLHKENLEEYTMQWPVNDYWITWQRMHAILWLKELEEEEKKLGRPLNDSVELLLDTYPK
ncbi:hypothetical protein MRB53_023087 [Persea americana]|uniref:Uncharacterized protein n=1 Tax=Persea americana TaxID=3435 RepID=A0ACC2L8I7_PERAE|nr:hypothetical protein MRB53_023087 [Persea americana]